LCVLAAAEGNWLLRFILSDCPSALHENSIAHGVQDLIITNITDDYYTIPAKSAAILAYAREVKARWVFKTDDDSFVNIPKLLSTFDQVMETQNYVGRIHINEKPWRNPASQFYVSETDFPPKVFPSFAGGVGYGFRGTARCTCFDGNLRSRMPLDPTHI
jgi:hypothetical protein